jgi:hypothetical protein
MSSSGTFVAKRFLRGINNDMINADYIVRIYVDPSGHLFADMANGPAIELYIDAPVTSPLPALSSLPVKLMSL